MKCVNCNNEIKEGFKFCNFCGAMQPIKQVISEDMDVALPPQKLSQSLDAKPNVQESLKSETGISQVPSIDNIEHSLPEKSKKKGISKFSKVLIVTIASLLVLAGAAYFIFFHNSVKRLGADPVLVEFTRKGGVEEVYINTDAKKFKVASHPNWVRIDSHNDEIVIWCKELKGYIDREGVIEITAGKKKTKITVKQSAAATYIKTSKNINVEANVFQTTIDIDTDGDVKTFETEISGGDWFSIVGKTNSSITLQFRWNDSEESRHGAVTISSGKTKETVFVEQAGICKLCHGTAVMKCELCEGYDENCPECGGDGLMPCRIHGK